VAGGDVEPGFVFTPDGSHLVYLADARYDGVDELFASTFSGAPVRLSEDLGPVLGEVSTFALTKGARRAVYLAVRHVHTELFSDPLEGPPAFEPLSPPLPAGQDVVSFQLTAEGRTAVFVTSKSFGTIIDLYGVPSDGSLASVQLNPSSLTNSQFLLTTDGARVLYLSTSLYSTAVDGSTVPVQLNAPLS